MLIYVVIVARSMPDRPKQKFQAGKEPMCRRLLYGTGTYRTGTVYRTLIGRMSTRKVPVPTSTVTGTYGRSVTWQV